MLDLEQDKRARLGVTSLLDAVAVIGSVSMLAGLYFGYPFAVTRFGPFASLRPDTAICLSLLSIANALPDRLRRLCCALNLVVAATALITIMGYTLRFPQPIDLVLEGFHLVPAGQASSMHLPFSTSLSLLMLCLALLVQHLKPARAMHMAYSLAAAALAGFIMVQSMIELAILPPNQEAAGTHAISLQCAILVCLLGLTLSLKSVRRLFGVGYRRLDHYLAWSTLALAATFLLAWDYQERADWTQRAFETKVALQNVAGDVQKQLETLGRSQQHLANRWSIYGPPNRELWELDAAAVLSESHGISSIAYVDPDRVVRWRVARGGGNIDWIGRRVDDAEARRRAFDEVDRLKSMTMTNTLKLDDGSLVRLYLTPLFEGSAQKGYILAALQLADLPGLYPSDITQDFNVALQDFSGEATNVIVPTDDLGSRVRQAVTFATFGKFWTLVIWPKDGYILNHRSRLLNPTLLFGGLITFLVGAALSQTRRSQISLRREAEAKSRLVTTLEHISDAFVTIDRNWQITFANGQASALSGLPPDNMVGQHLFRPPDDACASAVDDALLVAMEGGGTGRFITQFPATGRWVDVAAYPARDGIAVHFRDITKERVRDEHLHLLESAVARQNDVLIITEADLDGPDGPRIVYVNDAFTRLTGLTREEVMGRSPRVLQGPKTNRESLDRIRAAASARQPIQLELVNYARDGSEYTIEIDITPILAPDGTCTHFVAVERDITQRKRLQAQAIYNEERFQHVVDVTNDIIWDLDLATGVVQYNEKLKTLLGYDPAQGTLTSSDWESWLHPEDRARAVTEMAAAIYGSTVPVELEYRLRRANGSVAHIIDRAKVIRDAEGKSVRIVGVMSDVTERRALNDRLRQSQQLEALGQLTGGVAHDFNNLLTVILGNSELLADRLTDAPKLQKLAETTVNMALRGSELTRRLLAFARRQPLEPKSIDVNKLLFSMESWLRRTLPENIEIAIDSASDLGAIEVDPRELENALLNLAVNARDAMPQGGRLLLATDITEVTADDVRSLPEAKPGRYLRISVTDTGTGMDSATLAHAFEPFFTTKALGKGSGLGLSMVYGFVRQSAGFALIESTLGAGTTVRLHFPLVAGQDQRLLKVETSAASAGGSEHILVVEDDEHVLENAVAQLRGLGYRVSAALAGSAALTMIKHDPTIALLFTDVVMPGDLSGPELVKRALDVRPDLRVLYTSGYAADTIIHDGKLDEGLNLLSKPYRVNDLAEKVRGVLAAPC